MKSGVGDVTAGAPVAIVGVGCTFPDAPDVPAFTDLLMRGHCAIRELPASRFDRELYYSPTAGIPGTTSCWRGGLIDSFVSDLSALGLSASAAEALDPFHSIVLRAALEAFASAGLSPAQIRGRSISVLLGCARGTVRGEDHLIAREAANALLAFDDVAGSVLPAAEVVRLREEILAVTRTRLGARGNEPWPASLSHAIAGVVAHAFGLGGRHAVVDSACASTFSALHAGVRLIRQGRTDMALVGGGSMLCPGILVLFSQAGTVSSDGSFPFDERASGFIPGEGVGMVLLKRFEHAVRDGDRIYGVVRGVASACDGRGKAVWAPRKEGQISAISRAYIDAGVDPASVGMIEAHATSTRVGDTTEIAALSACFGPSGARGIPVGSVKGNLGHLIEGAGAPSLLKVLAAFERDAMPPSIGYSSPNPDIDWESTPLRHATGVIPWPKSERPRIGGVDSFGIGGLDCHVVVEEPPSGARIDQLVDMARRWTPKPRVPIAVVGLGCVLPGARNAAELREIVSEQRHITRTTAPSNRVDARLAPAGVKTAAATFEFDWKRFGVPPMMVSEMDPLQLMTMEAASQVVAALGGPDTFDRSRVGLFMCSAYYPDQSAQVLTAVRCVEYARDLVAALVVRGIPQERAQDIGKRFVEEVRRRQPPLNADTVANCTQTALVYRVAKLLDLTGPTHCVDGGGAGASLAAVEVGCETLWQQEADLVLCGGGDRSLRLQRLEETPAGVTASEGLVMFGLKRLPDALAAGDEIIAQIDGIDAAGVSGGISDATAASAFDVFGDTQGVDGAISLARAFVRPGGASSSVAVLDERGTSYRFAVTPSVASTSKRPIAAPETQLPAVAPAREPLLVRASTRETLAATLESRRDEIGRARPGTTTGTGAAVVGMRSGPDLASRITLALDVIKGRVPAHAAVARGVALGDVATHHGPCFLFPGLGSQYPGMLRELVAAYPCARARVAEIDRIVGEHRLPGVLQILADEARLASDARYTQIAVLAGDLATYDVARSHGVVPGLVSGHSFGDYAALVAAGAWSLADAIKIALRRAELIAKHAPAAAMLSVFASRERVERLLRGLSGYAAASNINSPDQIVVSGETRAIDELEARCKRDEIECRRLAVPTGFHSEILRPLVEPFGRALAEIAFSRPAIPFLSSTTATLLDEPGAIRSSLVEQLVAPVDFVAQIERAYASGVRVFVETGANNILTRLASRILEGQPAVTVALDEKRKTAGAELVKLECALTAIRAAEASPTPGETSTECELFDRARWDQLASQPGWDGFWRVTRPMLAQWATDLFGAAIVERRAVPRAPHPVKIVDVTLKRAATRPMPALPPRARPQASVPPPPAADASPPAAASIEAAVQELLIDLVIQRTGYPRDLIDLDATLEADLGIDTVKQVDLLGAVRLKLDLPRDPSVNVAQLSTLRKLRDHVVARLAGTAAVTPPAPATDTRDDGIEGEVTSFLLDLVIARTGYPRDLIDLDALLEADLGIDTVKQVELLGAVRKHLDLPRDPAVNVAALSTLRKVRDHVVSRLRVSVPAPAPVAPASSSDVEHAVTELLVDLVVARTGYPRDLVDLDATLEADLGIDTVKQVELLGAVRKHLDLPRDPAVNVAALSTLRKIRDHVLSKIVAAHPTSVVTSELSREAAAPVMSRVEAAISARVDLPAATTDDGAHRYVLRTRLEACTGVVAGRYRPRRMIVLGASKASTALATAMQQRGCEVEIVGVDDAEAAVARVDQLSATAPHPDLCVMTALGRTSRDLTISLGSLAADTSAVTQAVIDPTYRAVQAWARHRGNIDATLCAVTGMGGAFGEFPARGWLPEGGAMSGLLKALRRELDLRVKLLDVDPAESAETIATTLLRELDSSDPRTEAGLLRGARRVPELVLAPLRERRHGVVPASCVITGGGRGITAHIAVALAQAGIPRIVLIGRTTLGLDRAEIDRLAALGAQALRQEVLEKMRRTGPVAVRDWNAATASLEAAIEVAETIRRIEATGAAVEYHACDVSDRDALADVLKRVRAAGPIEAVVHGAGLEFSRSFLSKPREELDLTLAVKVRGAMNLLALTEADPVRWFAAFSSVSGRFGGFGQADYSLANEWLSRLCAAAAERAPDRRIVSIAWPPWDGVGMAVRGDTKERLASAGMRFLAIDEGCRHFVREMLSDSREVDVTYAPDTPAAGQYGDIDKLMPDHARRAAVLSLSKEIEHLPLVDVVRRASDGEVCFECRVDPRRDVFLTDHKIDGIAIVPAIVMAELASEAARMLRPGVPIAALVDFAVEGPIKLPHDGLATVRVTGVLRDGSADIAISSDMYARAGHLLQVDVPRATMRIEYGTPASRQPTVAQVAGKRMPFTYARVGEDSPQRLRWGDAMMCLQEMIIGSDTRHGAVLRALAPEALRPGRDTSWWCPAPLLDGTLVMSWMIVHHVHSPQLGQLVPVRMSRLVVNRSPAPGELCHAVIDLRDRQGRDFTFDLSVFDEAGQFVLSVDGLLKRTLDVPGEERTS